MPTLQISTPQSHLLKSKTRGTILLSSIGGGKSFIICLKAITMALEGKRVLFLSPSLNNIRDNIVPLFTKILNDCSVEYKLTRSPAINIAINNIDIMLRTGSEPDTLRGPSVAGLIFDEGRELTREAFDIGLGRLRDGTNLQWFISSTTRGKDWIYKIIEEQELTSIFEEDKRTVSNDYLTVIRTTIDEIPHLSEEYVKDLKRQYTTNFAKQELYALILETGNSVINPDWFIIKPYKKPATGVRAWDLAVSTKETADFSAGTLMSKDNNQYQIHNIKRVKLQYPDLKKLIIATAAEDGTDVHICLEDAGQQGAIRDDLRRESLLTRYTIKTYRPTKDKITRALPFASQAEFGNVSIASAAWNRQLKDECSTFGVEKNKHDDIIDSCVMAYNMLNTGGPPIVLGMG